MLTSDFDYFLPPELIAQIPAPQRDASRLMIVDRAAKKISHGNFRDFLKFFRNGDVLVLNNSRVIPARLRGVNARSGGQFEILLLEENSTNDWWVMLRPGKRARAGTEIVLTDPSGKKSEALATVIEINEEGHRRLKFSGAADLHELLPAIGEIPLPLYIERADSKNLSADEIRYQTVYAEKAGSVAAPTAGLHFTGSLLEEIRALGVHVCFVTLHVGLGTFAPVKADELSAHIMHEERCELSDETASIINQAKANQHRVFAVGTTSVRVLESFAERDGGILRGGKLRTKIFIYPPKKFRIVDALLTNFHLPRSTLLMLVSAFCEPDGLGGKELALRAYAEAVRERYRFFSYGDAMLIF